MTEEMTRYVFSVILINAIIFLAIGALAWRMLWIKGWRDKVMAVCCFIPLVSYFMLVWAIGAPDKILRRRIEEVAMKNGLDPDPALQERKTGKTEKNSK